MSVKVAILVNGLDGLSRAMNINTARIRMDDPDQPHAEAQPHSGSVVDVFMSVVWGLNLHHEIGRHFRVTADPFWSDPIRSKERNIRLTNGVRVTLKSHARGQM